jgi:rhodanese-related sulfurtransferase
VTDGRSKAEEMSAEELARIAASVRIVDVRSAAEFEADHIDGAVHIPLHALSSDLPELAGASEVISVCTRGGPRSHEAAARLSTSRMTARAVSGGIVAWSDAQPRTEEGEAT